MIKKCWLLCIIMIPSLLSAQTSNGHPQPRDATKCNLQAGAEGDSDLPVFVLSYMNDEDLAKIKKSAGKRPYLGTVIMAQNRAGRDIPNVSSVFHGPLPVREDGIHFNAEGQVKLGKITASAVQEFYKAKE